MLCASNSNQTLHCLCFYSNYCCYYYRYDHYCYRHHHHHYHNYYYHCCYHYYLHHCDHHVAGWRHRSTRNYWRAKNRVTRTQLWKLWVNQLGTYQWANYTCMSIWGRGQGQVEPWESDKLASTKPVLTQWNGDKTATSSQTKFWN